MIVPNSIFLSLQKAHLQWQSLVLPSCILTLFSYLPAQVRLQTQDFLNPKYRGTWHCITDTVKNESVSAGIRAPRG